MEKHEIIQNLREYLLELSDEETRQKTKRYFKEEIKSYGIKNPVIHKISKDFLSDMKNLRKEDLFPLCETLWQSGVMEESIVACNWSYACRKEFAPSDFEKFQEWIDLYVNNWASCDTFCNHSMGFMIENYPELLPELKKFTLSDNRWMKRAAAVSLIIPARKGLFLEDILEIAEALLTDSDDMVQKGYGWMLKACSQAHQARVFDFVITHKLIMPRTALRYAIEKMPADLRAIAMSK